MVKSPLHCSLPSFALENLSCIEPPRLLVAPELARNAGVVLGSVRAHPWLRTQAPSGAPSRCRVGLSSGTLRLVSTTPIHKVVRRSGSASVSAAKARAAVPPRRLTLPSSGLAPAAQAWPSFHSGLSPRRLREPLMSNVGHLAGEPGALGEGSDMRFIGPSSWRSRRIRLRHVAAGSDLVAIIVRVRSRLRLPVA